MLDRAALSSGLVAPGEDRDLGVFRDGLRRHLEEAHSRREVFTFTRFYHFAHHHFLSLASPRRGAQAGAPMG
eukprot:CAMPEP_0115321500 /NCGR_PEP_ID=MMETSP0270-20121206/80896_1 /TAXON_ID=71861 /ORGANISM="Scrippsiella trochoidea, Strain CCMP3099" /LENGTH=71 /DNA_ID=CAMNT_0002741391 /DNA_START=223 /DNA_END=434 /DNA_ORIENTATION=+